MIYGTNIRKKEFKGKCIVAFVDFLGFSNEIKAKWNDDKNNPLDRIRSFVKDINRTLSRQRRKLEDNTNVKHTYNGCRIKTFSDSTIVSYGFDREPTNTQFLLGCLYVSHAISIIWRKALKEKFTIRGGIEYGDIYWGTDVIAGPSFVVAYELESKYAETSRVLLSDQMRNKLKEALENKEYDIREHSRAYYAHLEKCVCHFLLCDKDQNIIVSPHSLYDTYDTNKEKLITQLEEMQKSCRVMKAIVKYIPLLDILKDDYCKLSLTDLSISRNKY